MFILPSPTDGNFDAISMLSQQTHLEVGVRACQTAFLLLTPANLDYFSGFYVTIGQENRHTLLEEMGPDGLRLVARVITPDILDCNRYRWFWLRWTETDITLGSGRLDNGQILVQGGTEISHPNINTISLSTRPKGGSAQWIVSRDQGAVQLPFRITCIHDYMYMYIMLYVDTKSIT